MKQLFSVVPLLVCGLVTSVQGQDIDASVFGEIQPRNIGPAVMSGRITDIDSPQGKPHIIYVGTAGGGVWKSVDAGINFKSIFDDHPQSIGTLTVDPSNPDTVWVGTGEINTRNSVSYGHGLYKTTDGGENWKLMGFEDSERIAEIRVHPEDANVVYVAVLGHLWGAHETRGLYKTTDGGETWERILYVDENTGCIDLDLDPQNPDLIYAAMWQVRRWPWFFESGGAGSGLYKSEDGGKNFRRLTQDLPETLGRIDLDIAPSRPNRVYAMVEGGKGETGIYRSDDHGESWKKVSDNFNNVARPFYLTTVKVDPQDHNRVYNPSFQLSISKDGAESFSGFTFGGGVHADCQAIWINPDDPNHVILGTDGGIYISHNRGEDFRMVPNLPVSQFYRVTVDNARPYNVYGGLQDNGSWMGPSAAAGGINNRDWENVGGGDGFCVMADREDPHIVYWSAQGGNLNRRDMETGENKSIVPYVEQGMERDRWNWNTPLVASPTTETINVGSQYVYRSTDNGDSWTRISPDLTTDDPEKQKQENSGGLTRDVTSAETHCTIFTIEESPLDAQVIWVGTDDGNLMLSRDGGKNWENKIDNIEGVPANTWVSSVWPSRHKAGTVYVTFTGHRLGDKTPYVYRSDDFGASWTSLASDVIKTHCHVIRQDLVNPDLLFLGTENGLYLSIDNGKQWLHFTNGLPPVSIREMAFQEREQDLVLATHGRGIYIFDDLTPMRAITKETLSQKVAILPNRPALALTQRGRSISPGGTWYTAPNPGEGINIIYYLQRRHIFGNLTIEVADADGDVIKTLQAGKRKGINRVYWSTRLRPPRVAAGRTFAAGGLTGPRAPEGTYTVRLIKGKETYETTVEVAASPLSKHSAEDRAIQYETMMALYRLQEDLGFLSDQIKDLEKQCEDRKEKTDNKKLTEQLEKRVEDLTAFHDTIVSPSDSVFVDQDRLREFIVSLYFAVSGYKGRPTANQLDRAKGLELQFQETKQRAESVLAIAELNKTLARRKLDPLTLLDRETWEKDREEGSAGGVFTHPKYLTVGVPASLKFMQLR